MMEPGKETAATSEQKPRPTVRASITNRQPKVKRRKKDLEDLKKEVVMVRMSKANCP